MPQVLISCLFISFRSCLRSRDLQELDLSATPPPFDPTNMRVKGARVTNKEAATRTDFRVSAALYFLGSCVASVIFPVGLTDRDMVMCIDARTSG